MFSSVPVRREVAIFKVSAKTFQTGGARRTGTAGLVDNKEALLAHDFEPCGIYSMFFRSKNF